MTDFARAVRVELLKLRRTLALLSAVLVPLVVVGMTTALNLSRDRGGQIGGRLSAWDSLMLTFVMFLWCLVGLPLFIALETALLAGLEHRENAWKHLFALPISRVSIYGAKVVVGAGLVLLSTIVLVLGIVAEGGILITLRPDLGLALPIPWGSLFQRAADFTAASLLVLVIQTWVAIRWRSFPLAAGLGIAGTVAGLIISISPRSVQVASLYPWSLPFVAVGRPVVGARPELQTTALLLGVAGGIVLAGLAGWDLARQDVL